MHVASTHRLYKAVHVACFSPVRERELILCRGESQGTNHHGGQGVCKLAFEHRAFTSNDAMILSHLVIKERWESIRKVNLPRTFKISAGAVEIEGHHAEVCLVPSQDVTYLPQHFLDTHIAAGIARAVVASEEQLQLFSWGPTLTEAEHPAEAPDFNQRADPGNEKEVRHARALPTAAFFSVPGAQGQGLAGN